jgi:hypothetical protein
VEVGIKEEEKKKLVYLSLAAISEIEVTRIQVQNTCHSHGFTSYLHIITSIMPKQKLARLAAPLNSFMVPVVSWHPNPDQFEEFQEKWRITYFAPELIEIDGSDWHCIAANDVNNQELGKFLLPLKYYQLWRRLVYGALLQEKMFEAWIQRTKQLRGRRLNAVEEEMINLRNTAGLRLIQYLLYRRLVLEELMKLRFKNPNPVVLSLIEFGIRESRDWMFETFENAKIQGARYLRLDPTDPNNEKEFGESQGF